MWGSMMVSGIRSKCWKRSDEQAEMEKCVETTGIRDSNYDLILREFIVHLVLEITDIVAFRVF
jgi:hypothetical protein